MHQTLARIDAELAQFVSWDGRSGDAASSSATDLDDERGPCTEVEATRQRDVNLGALLGSIW